MGGGVLRPAREFECRRAAILRLVQPKTLNRMEWSGEESEWPPRATWNFLKGNRDSGARLTQALVGAGL